MRHGSALLLWLCFATACSAPPPATPRPHVSAGGAGLAGAGQNRGGNGGVAAGSGGAPSLAGGSGGATGGGSAGASGGDNAQWPNGATAAVTLTYDDGLDSHLSIVGPALALHNLKATFFLSNFEGVDHEWALPNPTSALNARHLAWQAMASAGHELASHTVNHPCNAAGKAAGYELTDYDMPRMSAELDDSLARLRRLGATSPLTFAYPCSSDRQGIGPAGEDFSSLVAARFVAARVSTDGIAHPQTVDLQRVSQRSAENKSGPELRAMVDQAIAAGGWLVVLFHGVGSESDCPNLDYNPQACTINYLVTASDAHESLAAYLDEKSSQVWTATFEQVAEHIASRR